VLAEPEPEPEPEQETEPEGTPAPEPGPEPEPVSAVVAGKVGSGRIVVSEIEAPILLANMA
jgi:hypothetical protein